MPGVLIGWFLHDPRWYPYIVVHADRDVRVRTNSRVQLERERALASTVNIHEWTVSLTSSADEHFVIRGSQHGVIVGNRTREQMDEVRSLVPLWHDDSIS